MAEDPFCPLEKGSSASRTSVRCRWRTSVAKPVQRAGDQGQSGKKLGMPIREIT